MRKFSTLSYLSMKYGTFLKMHVMKRSSSSHWVSYRRSCDSPITSNNWRCRINSKHDCQTLESFKDLALNCPSPWDAMYSFADRTTAKVVSPSYLSVEHRAFLRSHVAKSSKLQYYMDCNLQHCAPRTRASTVPVDKSHSVKAKNDCQTLGSFQTFKLGTNQPGHSHEGQCSQVYV